MRPAEIVRLIDRSIYYELWKRDSLVYVVLNCLGQTEIANHYQKKYGIKINIAERDTSIDEEEDYLRHRMLNIYHDLQDKEAQGLVYTARSPLVNYSEVHAYPYIIGRKGGAMIKLDFTYNPPLTLPKGAKEFKRKINPYFPLDIEKTVYDFDNRRHYHDGGRMVFQAYGNSCATFALNTIKNALTSKEFMEEFFSDDHTVLSLKKTKMSQDPKSVAKLSEENRAKYVRKIGDEELNLQAFYKAHRYAQILETDHMSHLPEFTRNIIEDIDRVRAEYKEKKGLQLLVPAKKIAEDFQEETSR